MTNSFNFQGTETKLLHGGQQPDPSTGSRAVPIHQTTSYVFRDTEHAQNLFALAEPGNIYSRIMNPTVDAFEQRIALLEDGVAAVATASGASAITLAILNVAEAGDEIITDSNLYGGTYNLFSTTLPKYGITVKFVDGTDPENFRKAITPKTKAIFGEIITNPSLNIFDVEAVSTIAHDNGIPVIIDNTFASPYGAKPITWGADIVVHSATKWIGGHGTSIGGVVVDGGRFNWNSERFPGFTEPDPSYNGLRYAQDLGPIAYAIKLRVQLLRDIGACLSPQNAFYFLQGLETLNLRIEKHHENTKKVANYLVNHPAVEWVTYPGLEQHPSHQLAKKYLNGTFGSIVVFGIKGGREAGRKLIDNINLWSHVANVGDAKSLIIHPASTTHQQLSQENLRKSGVTEEMVRLSVGLETADDIIKDLDQAIAKATATEPTIVSTEETAVRWALSSPFAREEGLRQKTIAVVGLPNDPSDSNYHDLQKLQRLGYKVIPIDNVEKDLLGEATYPTIVSIPEEIDVLYVLNPEDPALLEDLNSKIIWFNTTKDYTSLKKIAKANNTQVVENRSPYQEADRLRSNNIEEPVSV
ncbi:aminotransferase class V-fold PLP-dependent enzyme [Aquibacillus halophilus]|uniref:O-succinylhomoserine sulfhydrylase n=1 Tax=Aquibacillus halophilus TaxID=930132 RepID=A0A6A8DJW4_9BACI|nr:PLP-dependent aspartate aminotransferase family protein [Aquibacillus halophilus]MRH44049.1 aminotransferase class V-fold PLP-dependent enzyme [Aquibacillus halophilus]